MANEGRRWGNGCESPSLPNHSLLPSMTRLTMDYRSDGLEDRTKSNQGAELTECYRYTPLKGEKERDIKKKAGRIPGQSSRRRV